MGRRGGEEKGRKHFVLALFVFLLAFWGCGREISRNKPQNVKASQTTAVGPAATPSVPKDGNYDGRGEVTKINNELGSVELKHEEIKDLMPAMQMEFFVKDKALLKGLAVGDKVDFVIEYKNPTETIVGIKKAQ